MVALLRARLAGVTLAVLLAARVGHADGLADVVAMLQPGSRPSLGLGGDPFLSPLDNGDAFWSAQGLAGPAGTRVESGFSAPVGHAGDLRSRSLVWSTTGRTRALGRELRVSSRITDARWEGNLAAASGAVRLTSRGTRWDAGARLTALAPGLALQVVGPLWSEGRFATQPSLGAGARYAPKSWVAVQSRVERARLPQLFESTLYGEPLSVSANTRIDRWQTDARFSLGAAWVLEGLRSLSWLHSLAGPDSVAAYSMAPGGQVELDQGSLEWRPTSRARALVRWTRSALDIGGEARSRGDRFAWLSYADVASRAWLVAGDHLGARGGRILVEAERVTADGEARGSVESWPFTPATVDLLGLRRIGHARGAAHWHRVHAAFERPFGAATSAACGVSWFDAGAAGALDSWRPAFLVFGQADLQHSALPWHRAQLALASVGLRRRMGVYSASVEIQQPVFARLFRTTVTSAAGAGAAEPRASASGAARRDLGTQARIALARPL